MWKKFIYINIILWPLSVLPLLWIEVNCAIFLTNHCATKWHSAFNLFLYLKKITLFKTNLGIDTSTVIDTSYSLRHHQWTTSDWRKRELNPGPSSQESRTLRKYYHFPFTYHRIKHIWYSTRGTFDIKAIALINADIHLQKSTVKVQQALTASGDLYTLMMISVVIWHSNSAGN